MTRRLALLLATLLCSVAPASAVAPGQKHALDPERTGLPFEVVSFPSAVDSVELSGWWFDGPAKSPVLVFCPRGRGTMADLLPSVRELGRRGFTVMTFDYRDFGPAGPGEADSLVQLAFASRWVNDAEGALRYARSKAGKRPVFAWGQDLGGAVAVAAAARDRLNADAVSCEGLFRTLNELLRSSGLWQVPGAPERHRYLVETGDEPVTSVGSLMVPLHVVIAMKDDVWPAAVTQEVVRRSLSRIDRWVLPEGRHEGNELTPGYYDRLSAWFTRIAAMIKAAAPPDAPAAPPAGR